MKFIILATCLVEIGLGLYSLRSFFQRSSQIILAHLLLLAGILLYCGGGTLLAYLTVSPTELGGMLIWRRIGEEHIFAAMVLTILFCLCVHWLAMRLIRYVGIPANIVTTALDRVSLNPYAFGLASLAILGAYGGLAATGRITFHGTETEQQASDAASDPLLMVMFHILFLLPLLCGYRLFVKGKLLPTLVVLGASAGFALAQGRRNLVLFLFFAVLGYALNQRLQVTRLAKGLVAACLVGLFLLGFLFSVAMRLATGYAGRGAAPAQVATLAYQMLLSGGQDQKTDIVANTQENVGVRAFNPVLFLASLLSADRAHVGAMGDVLLNGAGSAVPNAVWPQKLWFIRSEEEIAATTMHVPLSPDEAQTVISAAYNDFREAGILIYSLFVVLMFMVCVFLLKRTTLPVFKLLAFSVLLMTALNTEAQTSSWFLLLRNALAVYGINQGCLMFYPRARVFYIPARSAPL